MFSRSKKTTSKKIVALASPNTGSYPFFERRIGPLLGGRAEIFLSSNLDELRSAVDTIFEMRPDIIVICGGDGAMHVCLTAIADRYADTGVDIPQILMLALGTMNDAATSLKVDNPEDLLRKTLRKIDRGRGLKTKLFRPMTVNGECAFLYGAGIPVAFLQRYYRDKPPGAIGGPIGGGMTIGTVIWSEILIELGLSDNSGWLQRLLHMLGLGETTEVLNEILDDLGMSDAAEWQAKDLQMRLVSDLDEERGPFGHCTGIMASVISQVGMGLTAFPNAMEHQGSFTMLTTNLTFAQILAFGPQILTGWGKVKGLDNMVLKKTIIEYAEPTVRMVDGDIKNPHKDRDVHPTRDILGIGPTLEIIVG